MPPIDETGYSAYSAAACSSGMRFNQATSTESVEKIPKSEAPMPPCDESVRSAPSVGLIAINHAISVDSGLEIPQDSSSAFNTEDSGPTTSLKDEKAQSEPPVITISADRTLNPLQSYATVYSRTNSNPTADPKATTNMGTEGNICYGGDVELGEAVNLKAGRQVFRWNLIFNLILWTVVPLPIWLPFVSQEISLYLLPSIQGAFTLFWICVCLLAIRTTAVMFWHRKTDFKSKRDKLMKNCSKDDPEGQTVDKTPIQHVAVLSCYKEPVDLIAASVQTLANQTVASSVTMVVSFEEKTPELWSKQQNLAKMFGSRFRELLFVTHPFGMEGEIPGKCSNSNCGIRTGIAHMKRKAGSTFDPDRILITTCDADSKFHPRYMEALEYKYEREFIRTKNLDRKMVDCLFQSPLLYNWNLDAASVVTRLTGMLRAFLMMGAMIPFNVNTMSIYSFSASLCIAGQYIHPGYQMDDIIGLIRWMGVCKRRLRIVKIPVPTLSGPTSGRVIEEELEEWARQARRWTIGAAEVFHYFMVKSSNIPFFTALSWGVTFIIYYGIILCCSSLYSITLAVSVNFLFVEIPVILRWGMLAFFVFNYTVFALIFILDRVTIRLTEPRVKERISFVRNLYQWIVSPFVLLAYSIVELYALHEVMVRGKKVCKHGASKKEALGPN